MLAGAIPVVIHHVYEAKVFKTTLRKNPTLWIGWKRKDWSKKSSNFAV